MNLNHCTLVLRKTFHNGYIFSTLILFLIGLIYLPTVNANEKNVKLHRLLSGADAIIHRDLSIVIWQAEKLDWIIDEFSIINISPRIMEIICASHIEDQNHLKAHLNDVIQQRGGFVKDRWKEGIKLSEFADDLHDERILFAIEWGQKQAQKCPIWLRGSQTKPFIGIHQDTHRFQLILESMGSGQLVINQSDWTVGAAAQGRALAMYGFGDRWGLAIGAELGAASIFPKDSEGRRTVEASWATGIPLVLRTWVGSFRYDTEIALLGRLADQSGQTIWGGRIAQAFGVSTTRIAGFLPHIMLWIGYEYFGDADTHILRAGSRVGVSWW